MIAFSFPLGWLVVFFATPWHEPSEYVIHVLLIVGNSFLVGHVAAWFVRATQRLFRVGGHWEDSERAFAEYKAKIRRRRK
jgi:hypothetical protein